MAAMAVADVTVVTTRRVGTNAGVTRNLAKTLEGRRELRYKSWNSSCRHQFLWNVNMIVICRTM